VRPRRIAALAIPAAAVIAIGLFPRGFNHFIGIDTQSSDNYAFFSGFGAWLSSTLGLTTIIVTMYKHLNCHADQCMRIGRFPVAGGAYKVCRHHHEHVTGRTHKLTADAIRAAHILHQELMHTGQGRRA